MIFVDQAVERIWSDNQIELFTDHVQLWSNVIASRFCLHCGLVALFRRRAERKGSPFHVEDDDLLFLKCERSGWKRTQQT